MDDKNIDIYKDVDIPQDEKEEYSEELALLQESNEEDQQATNSTSLDNRLLHRLLFDKEGSIRFLPVFGTLLVIGLVVVCLFVAGISVVLFLRRSPSGPHLRKKTLLLVSIDGFRWDYMSQKGAETLAPNLFQLMSNGARVQQLNPIFPSKTFPNHYTLATGLYAESHGIISNSFYDPILKKEFKVGSASALNPEFWTQGEPIWITLKRNGIDTAAVFWPGTDVLIRGERPKYWSAYDGSVSNEERVSKLLSLVDKDENLQFFITYFDEVDTAGHRHGPDSQQVKDALHNVDRAIGLLIKGFEERKLLDELDIIVVGDHGMTALDEKKYIDLSAYLTADETDLYSLGPVADLYLKKDVDPEFIFNKVRNISHVDAYRKHDIPEKFHYKGSHRVPEIVLVAELGYSLSRTADPWSDKGNHGYDPQYPDMKAGLIANGPSFESGVVAASVDNVHVYSLFCHLFGLKDDEIAPNNGTIHSIKALLKPELRP